MKKIYIIIIGLIFSMSGYSQLWVKGGIDIGSITGEDLANYKVGFHAGLTYDIGLAQNLYLKPGVLVSRHLFGLDAYDNVKEVGVSRYFIEVPMLVSYKTYIANDTRLALDLGPYAKFGFTGDTNYTYNDGTTSGLETYKLYTRNEIGMQFGANVEIQRILIGAAYQFSFTDAEKDNSGTHSSIFRISIGYKFN